MNEPSRSTLNLYSGMADFVELLHLSLKLQLGSRFWLYPLAPLLWLLLIAFLDFTPIANIDFFPQNVQNSFLGMPVYLLSIVLGMQIISSEIEQRTLEVCYTVPGGAKRIWLAKIYSSLVVLLAAELILALCIYLFYTAFPPAALYRTFQACIFFLMLSMYFGAIFKNKMTAGLASVIFLFFNGAVTGFGELTTRYSPFFNPMGLEQTMSTEEVLYWSIQNHIGFALLSLTLLILTFSRAERREVLLSDD